MNAPTLELGKYYNRRQISKLLGGEEVIYLPSKNGKIVAGCFDPRANLDAPEAVVVGDAPKVVSRARALGETKAEIPTFLKRGSSRWEYIGIYRCVSFSESKKDIAPYAELRPDAVGVLYFEEIPDAENVAPDPELIDFQATEGKQKLIEHFKKERNRGLIIAKRNQIRAAQGYLICESCGLTETELPKGLGDACFEVDHKNPISQLKGPTKTKLVDLHLLCANCHRLIHRSNPMLTPAQLQKHLKSSGNSVP
jgi:hypothetical protein